MVTPEEWDSLVAKEGIKIPLNFILFPDRLNFFAYVNVLVL